MATLSITCIRGNGTQTITTGISKDGRFVTLTGTIHDVEGFTQKVRVQGGAETKDLGDMFFGLTATVMLPVDQAAEVLSAVSDYYSANAELDIRDPKVGVVFEVKSLRNPIEGTHPLTGEKTYTVIVQNASFLEVCEGYQFVNLDELEATTDAAAAATANRSQTTMRQAQLMKDAVAAPAPAAKRTRKASV